MDFKIPKEFRIFGMTFNISYPNKIVVGGESVLGSCDSDNGKIEIRKNLKKELKEITFLHETVHAILDNLGYEQLSNDEVFVDAFAKAMHQVLKTSK